MKKLVCFGRKTWLNLKSLLDKRSLKRQGRGHCKKDKGKNGAAETAWEKENQIERSYLDGARIKAWWERENWDMVTEPENPFGDLTRETQFRVTRLLKGIW